MKKFSLATILLCTLTLVGQTPNRGSASRSVSYIPSRAESGARLLDLRQQVLRECSFAPRSERCHGLKELYQSQIRHYRQQQERREAQAKRGE